MIENTGQIASDAVKGLAAGGPLALPLVVINVICLLVVGYVLYKVDAAIERRDTLISELARSCQPIVEKPKHERPYKAVAGAALEQAVQQHFCQLFAVLLVKPDETGCKRFHAGLDKLADMDTTLASRSS